MAMRLTMTHLAALAALAAPATVTVSGPVYTPSGVAANGGTVTATLAAPCSIGTEYVHRGPVSATIASDGALSVALVPTASCAAAGNSYAVRYRATRSGVPLTEYSETWTIPASPSSTTIAAVRSATVPSPLAAVSWTQLTSIPTPVSAIIATASANRVFAGPASGGAAVGAYRALVAADIPAALNATTVSTTLQISGQSSGNTAYLQVNGTLLDILGGTGGFRVLNNAGTAANLSMTDAGALTLGGLAGTGTRPVCATAAGQLTICP